MAIPNTNAYEYWYQGSMITPLKTVAIPPIVIATLFRCNALTLSKELRKPHTILATVLVMPMAETIMSAAPSDMPESWARLEMYRKGTKKPIMVKKPLKANSMKVGDLNKLTSNMVARVRRTASGQILHEDSASSSTSC